MHFDKWSVFWFNMEIWKDIQGYKGSYQASSLGKIKSVSRLIKNSRGNGYRKIKYRFLSQYLSGKGYYEVSLYKNGKRETYSVHVLIGIAFLGHNPNGHILLIDHKNNIKTDNKASNLQVITNRKNLSKNKTNKTSKYTGVSLVKVTGFWRSDIYINNKQVYLGSFKVEIDAHITYQNKLKEL